MPESIEWFEIFESDQHAISVLAIRVRGCGTIDEDPEMEFPEDLGFFSSRHAGDFTLAPDMFYGLSPWSCDFDEDIVLKDFLGLSIDLVASLENGQLVLIVGGLIGVVGLDF